MPSYREVLFDCLKGRWSQEDIQKYIKFSTVVRDVVYNKATDDFTVSVKDLKNDEVIDGERYKNAFWPAKLSVGEDPCIMSISSITLITTARKWPNRIPKNLLTSITSIIGLTTWWWPPVTIPLPMCQPSLGLRGSLAG